MSGVPSQLNCGCGPLPQVDSRLLTLWGCVFYNSDMNCWVWTRNGITNSSNLSNTRYNALTHRIRSSMNRKNYLLIQGKLVFLLEEWTGIIITQWVTKNGRHQWVNDGLPAYLKAFLRRKHRWCSLILCNSAFKFCYCTLLKTLGQFHFITHVGWIV